jgi:hypothetical protein
MKARDMALWIHRAYPTECQAKLDRSASLHSEADLIQQLVAEIGAQRPQLIKTYPQIRVTEGRPRRYYWSNESDEDEVAQAEHPKQGAAATEAEPHEATSTPNIGEVDLYPKLAEFLRVDSGLYVQRIDERRSSNRRGPQGNRWLFPDLVALEDLTREWTREVRECVSEAGARKTRLWSLEVKLLLNRSNVRESYFQAVSNSSWANLGDLYT